MRFWQALLTAQMAAGAVWADGFRDNGFWIHAAADAGNILIGAAIWFCFSRFLAPPAEACRSEEREP